MTNYKINTLKHLLLISFCISITGQAFYAVSADKIPISEKYNVEKSFDGHPFEYQTKLLEKHHKYTVYKLTYPSPYQTDKTEISQNNIIHARYYLPNNIKPDSPPRAGVICLHILGGGRSLTRFISSYMAEQGIPALMPLMPFYGERKPNGWSFKRKYKTVGQEEMTWIMIRAYKQAIEDIRRSMDVLSSRPEVDPEKITLEGVSLGAILGSAAAGVDKRFHKLILVLGGGNFQKIIGNSRETRFIESKIMALSKSKQIQAWNKLRYCDPLTHAENLTGLAKKKQIMMVNAANDEVIPPKCSSQLAEKLGMKDQVQWLAGHGHYTALAVLPDLLAQMVQFITDGKNKTNHSENGTAVNPPLKISHLHKLLLNFAEILSFTPAKDRCHIVDVAFQFSPSPKAKQLKGNFEFIRGEKKLFKMTGNVPKFGKIAIGYADYPWLQSKNGTLFLGQLEADTKSSPVNFVDPVSLGYLKMGSGFCMMAVNVPDMLKQFATIKESKTPDGKPILEIIPKKNKNDLVKIILQKDRDIPETIEWHLKGAHGKVNFNQWRTNAFSTPELFMEPEGKKSQIVKQRNLDRIFAAFINQLGDTVKK